MWIQQVVGASGGAMGGTRNGSSLHPRECSDAAIFGDVADPLVWSQIHDEGTQVLENIANIRVPVIAAIE
jgi:hypothetical protein